MPSESLSDITQRQWLRACAKLGMVIKENVGKGSHVTVMNPRTGARYDSA